MTTVHNRIGGQRGLVTALGALETAITFDSITMPMTANRAYKTVRPLNLVEIFKASFLIRETLDKLTETQGFFL